MFQDFLGTYLALINFKGGSVLGRVMMGFMSDKFNPWALGISSLVTTSMATFVLWGVLSHSFPLLLVFALAYGSLAGGWSSLWTGLVRPIASALIPSLFT